jgi:hypothetical protein
MDTSSSYNLYTTATGELYDISVDSIKINHAWQPYLVCEILWQPTIFIEREQRNLGEKYYIY